MNEYSSVGATSWSRYIPLHRDHEVAPTEEGNVIV